MAFEKREVKGAAAATTISGAIVASDLAASLASASGWPTGGANGPFFAVLGEGLANPEKIRVQSRTGSALTIAARGVDDTVAADWPAGTTIKHCVTAQDLDEANQHITNTALDHHTQYHTAARHAAVAHTSGMLGADSVGASQIQANAVGSSELANDAVDTAAIQNLAVTAAKIADLTVTGGKIADLTITGGKIANDTVTATQIAADAVGSSELANNAVDAAAIAASAVTAGKIATGGVSATAQIADGIVTLAKLASEASTDFSGSVTFTNPTGNFVLGTGGVKYANYFKMGRIVLAWVHFQLGTGGNITAGGTIEVSLPFANTASHRGFAAAKARQAGGTVASGTAAIGITSAVVTNFVTAGVSAAWDATTPFNWDVGDSFDAVIVYEAAA